jgi:hypothetical protein
MPTNSSPADLVRLLASAGQPKAWLERKIAELGQGVVAALRDSTLPVEDAWDELFNLKNYQSIRAGRLSKDLKTMFEWGMELHTVAKHAPHALGESFDEMERLAKRVIAHSCVKRKNGAVKRPRSSGGTRSRSA